MGIYSACFAGVVAENANASEMVTENEIERSQGIYIYLSDAQDYESAILSWMAIGIAVNFGVVSVHQIFGLEKATWSVCLHRVIYPLRHHSPVHFYAEANPQHLPVYPSL